MLKINATSLTTTVPGTREESTSGWLLVLLGSADVKGDGFLDGLPAAYSENLIAWFPSSVGLQCLS